MVRFPFSIVKMCTCLHSMSGMLIPSILSLHFNYLSPSAYKVFHYKCIFPHLTFMSAKSTKNFFFCTNNTGTIVQTKVGLVMSGPSQRNVTED